MATGMLDRPETAAEDALTALELVAGADRVVRDPGTRALASQDIYTVGATCAAVLRPRSIDELIGLVSRAAAAGFAIHPRGAGMSYTGGYLPASEHSVVLDLAALDRIVEINATDMYVTVEPACTWAALDAALAEYGLRTPFWGPLSGLKSSIGGAISQNSVFLGSGMHGTAADSVIGLEVVLADGRVVATGSGAGTAANAFLRHHGPDLTGLFTGDAGAFGVKARITLRLIPRPAHKRFLSFAFEDRDAMTAVMARIGREGLASECFAFDPYLQSVRMKRTSLMTDLKVFGAVLKSSGIKEGLRMAVAGRKFAEAVDWPLHVAIEGRSAAAVDADMNAVRAIAVEHGAAETENTVPKAVHASPFMPLNGMVGTEGERWVPVHGVLPQSRINAFLVALDRFFADEADAMTDHGVTSGYLMMVIASGAFLIEPVFYWRDALLPIHESSIEPSFLAKLDRFDENFTAREYVGGLRRRAIDLFATFGASHFQIGKTYPYVRTRRAVTADLVRDIKQVVDPTHCISPLALELD